MSQTIDLIMTIKTSTGSSKSELSSRGKRPFKVYDYSANVSAIYSEQALEGTLFKFNNREHINRQTDGFCPAFQSAASAYQSTAIN